MSIFYKSLIVSVNPQANQVEIGITNIPQPVTDTFIFINLYLYLHRYSFSKM